MDKTFKLKLPIGFNPVARLAWKLMEDSHDFYEHDGRLAIIDESAGFAEPTWEGDSVAQLEQWLILCFQQWIASGPDNNPMWEPICECLDRWV